MLTTNNTLQVLNLNRNEFYDFSNNEKLGSVLPNSLIETVYRLYSVWKQAEGGAGVWKLAEALEKNNTLKALYLSYSNIGDTSAIRLAQAIKNNNSLQVLDLSSNKELYESRDSKPAATGTEIFIELSSKKSNLQAPIHSFMSALKENDSLIYLNLQSISSAAFVYPVNEDEKKILRESHIRTKRNLHKLYYESRESFLNFNPYRIREKSIDLDLQVKKEYEQYKNLPIFFAFHKKGKMEGLTNKIMEYAALDSPGNFLIDLKKRLQ
ncbi:MAG: hypothetical protein JWM09_1152 [Francisellaceae bacterium]|nr:hypothetical protein [Francisellaceae bacterium]